MEILLIFIFILLITIIYFLRRIALYLDSMWWRQWHRMDIDEISDHSNYQIGIYEQPAIKQFNYEKLQERIRDIKDWDNISSEKKAELIQKEENEQIKGYSKKPWF